MQWSYAFAPKQQQQQQYGWNTTSSDYHSHIMKIERMPSVLDEVPHYPDVHKAFNNKHTYGDQEQESIHHEVEQHQIQESSPKAKAKKKVQVTEHAEIVESAKEDGDDHDDGNNDDKNREVREDTIDIQADGFIQRMRKGFELRKWKTFKLY